MNNLKNSQKRTWIEISKKAINNNIAQYKKIIGNNILAPVIKANAYGHGIIEVAQTLQQNKNVDWLCTTSLQEALILRKNSIFKKILVLSYIDELNGEMAKQAVLQQISLVAFDIATIHKLNATGKKANTKVNIHIKIDTGLSRLGILTQNAMPFILQVQKLPFIHIQGIWTHFSESPAQDRSFTNLQINKFNNLIKKLKNLGIQIPLIHTSNSAGISTTPIASNNFFRLGIGLYGHWPSEYVKKQTQQAYPDFKLEPILTWKSKIFCIRDIPAKSFIGYCRTHQLKKNSKLATIPVGYYDGYERKLSNKGSVIIHNQVAPIIGIVCMNVLSVDISHIKNVNIGDEVILMGNLRNIHANKLAKLANTNPRELTTKINPNIPRIIVD